MGIEELSVRNGRAVSDRWADSVVVRPRTPERHVAVHKRLVLAFAVSILTLVVVTAVAVTLAVSFEKCGSSGENVVPPGTGSNRSRDRSGEQKGGDVQPWRRLRLPTALRPRHYDLQLSVYMHNFTFSGEVSIELECVNATKFIVLHADRLHVEKVAVYSDSKKPGAMRIHRHFRYPHNQVHVIALHREMKPLRTYTINMSFQAQIQNQLLGFFHTSYVLHGERRYAAVTQFSPTHARKAFPCFDEPVYKATFSVTLRHDASYQSVSNMPIESSSLDEDGWLTNRFSRTPRMSTYYVSWAVCDFSSRETMTHSGVMIRLFARPDAIQSGSGDYALHITKSLLNFYQDYFRVTYPLPKLDLLAVPKHPYAAMENWGLSVFVEQKILLDPEVSSFSYQMDLTMVVVHEICHQWLGDLVTPVWWDDVWIKEGFAHYFEYVGSDFLFPKWNMKQRFLTDVLHEVMLLDGMATSHPISEELFQVADIHRVFDWISYKKGAALIRMLANVMGQTAFQRGINDYLVTHEYGNTARDDLWNSFSQALQREGKDISIKEVMDGWTLQMGYPVVTISKHESLENTVTISQEHFLYDKDAKIHHRQLFNKSLQWQIPLNLALGNFSHMSSESLIWISNKTETHRVGRIGEETWLLGNINQTGYFRVNYDLHNWRLLIQQLMLNPTIISVGNRAGLVDDVFSLARAGYLPQNLPLQIICYLSKEDDFLPWHAASRALYQLDKLLDRTEDYSLFSSYVLKQVELKYHKLDWPRVKAGDSFKQATYHTNELQREVIMLACSFGNKHCHRQAMSLVSEWISSNKNRLLNASLNSDLVPDQDVIDVIIHVGRNPHARHLAWRYFREKWDELNSRFGEALFLNSKLISGVTEFLNTQRELDELKDFIQTSAAGGSASAFSRALEVVQANVKWHELYRESFFQWLRKSSDG
ncbi:thyrotropin-releasing hormone-degrading ectoenzyme-like isoform X2 [Pangasianodon hypophthalmus]|uniref:thyrotropin-releasing hormone-degrading ectoenzyme-like isoform X2 n=1 Tax=Pangasianodon hypophthalmus TaxID=310915 RepID=UPI00230753DA|nr:thyrotropin-releasing hormone-degrading ectoenzyme-like isoform X2 [Pangasianodon hypophthalmus]